MHTTRRAVLGATAASLALLAGCASSVTAPATATPPPPPDPSAQLNAALDRVALQILHEQPERCTALGLTEARAGGRFIDRLNDASKEAARRYRGILENSLAELHAIDRNALPSADKVTLDVVTTSFSNSIASSQFEIGGGAGAPYVVSQLTGAYRSTPDFLDAQHPLRNRDEVDAYFSRVSAFARQMDQETAIISEDASAGIVPPDFVIDKTLVQMRVVTDAAPRQNVLVQTLVRRLPQTEGLSDDERTAYANRAEAMVRGEILPAYGRQVDALRAIRPRATHEAGIGHLPHGPEMYAAALRSRTTTDMTPDDIHNSGVQLIAQLQAEMDTILRAQGMRRGSVSQRMSRLALRRDQLYPNTDAGRAQILADLNQRTRDMVALMPRMFNVLARAQLEIRRVPAYTQAGAPGGYYQRGALDGSRPGAYYINLRDTAEWPRFKLPTLNYHEGVPGHHWQISIQQETGALPFVRSALLFFSAFSEGWGLYAEQLADELGVYEHDPLGRLGYLQSATFRASRLVCDTGLHAKGWSREQAIRSMREATGDKESSIATEIERYCVQPGQACAYMIGRQTINRLRQEATASMSARFDLKRYHDLLMATGAVPLNVLERVVRDWAAQSA
ncbi:MAG: DUF885 family protein [Proteobacteria bacterium]|nr:DUF885 family protein [Pseudomonadota bacterium]